MVDLQENIDRKFNRNNELKTLRRKIVYITKK